MIFFTAYINEPHGAAKSAIDFLKALTVVCKDVTVIAPKKVVLPDLIVGHKTVKAKWYLPNFRNREILRLLKPPKTNFYTFFNIIVNRIRRLQINKNDTVIVNSWGSKTRWNKEKDIFKGKKVLIIRESVRHYSDEFFGITPEKMIDFFNEFQYLIFVSQNIMNEWIPLLETKRINCFYLPNCIDEEAIAKLSETNRKVLRKSIGIQEDDYVIICTGTIQYRKGQDLIIKHYNEIIALDEKIKILILGNAFTEYGKHILQQLDNYNRIIRLPAQESALEYLQIADLLLFPSRAEAMPRTILEAMAIGLPVIASSVDGIPELIIDGYNGYLFDPEKSENMVKKIELLIRNQELTTLFSLRSKEIYYNKFSRIHHIERLRNILKIIDNSETI